MKDKEKNILLYQKFLKGEILPNQEIELFKWLESSESQESMRFFYKEKWDSIKECNVPAEIQNRMLEFINKHKQVENSNTSFLFKCMRYAAIIIFSFIIGISAEFIFNKLHNSSNNTKKVIITANKGQRAKVTLADGTKVWLNSDSELKYDNNYGTKERNVWLKGEGYFEVTKDSECSFTVICKDIEVEALGTIFNVKSYPKDKKTTVSLVQGKVKTTANNKSITMKSNECVSYCKCSGRLYKENLEYFNNSLMWKENQLAFNSAKLKDMAIVFSRIYNINVVFNSEDIKEIAFSGVIKNNSLENVLELINITSHIDYEINKDTVYFTKKINTNY